MPDMSGDPRLITLVLIITAASMVAAAFPKILGPIGESVSGLLLKMRRTSDELASIDVEAIKRRMAVIEEQAGATEAGLRKSIDQLRGDIACRDARLAEAEANIHAMRQAEHAHDAMLADHTRWDRLVTQRLAREGIELPDPPPLWPTITP